MTSTTEAPTKVLSHKTHHRWTSEEDTKLSSLMQEMDGLFKTIGAPGGIKRPIFWAQIPGRLGVPVTPDACAMRWRTLMDLKRRADSDLKAEHDEIQRNEKSAKAAAQALAAATATLKKARAPASAQTSAPAEPVSTSAQALDLESALEIRSIKSQVLELRKMLLHLIKINEQVLTNQVEMSLASTTSKV